MGRSVLAAIAVVSLLVSPVYAQAEPAKIYVEGGPKEMKSAVLALLRQQSDMIPVPYAKRPEANINLQKKGGANVKCGDEKTFLPGPTAEDIVTQFRAWLFAGPLSKRRAAHAGRGEKVATAVAVGAVVALVAVAAASSEGAAAAPSSSLTTSSSDELLVFGGRNHDVFLGCLTCGKYASNSVLNTYGEFGSRYSSTSVANRYGTYGSRYSSDSVCNPYASDPPVIVDREGGYYGELTMNRTRPNRTRISSALQWLAITCAD